MSRLIFTFTDSGAGGLKAARLADCVISIEHRFVCGRLPASGDFDALFAPRAAAHGTGPHWLDNLTGRSIEAAHRQGLGLIEFCERFDAVDLWVGPDPNSQLQLIWLLDYLRPHANVTSRLAVFQTNHIIGEQQPAELAAWQLQLVPIRGDHLEAAGVAWTAWRASTPEAWFNLLRQDLGALPRLRSSVVALLEELPSRGSGLGATEMRLLELISAGHVHPYELFPGHQKLNDQKTFDYWEAGALLDGLAHCPVPVISGLVEGPFDLAMHEDPDRHQRYKRSRLALTALGQAIVAGAGDFSQHNPIDRWWGGTKLTNDRLWRWDAESRTLVAP
ncbi:hypothetical protein GPL21_11615 [Bradyrhizobium pachyrhizi]|uniref:DUF1835 domain-containing protein n=1 Tax=Bradyrhizobium pachyrhizi TaxID=280333 RepID=A0A844SJT5_9BRAD|nr:MULTISPECIES: hypothetical protein [Bradyrhizobium]MVT65755.1 hypothetical protein [Bradyrhizobium pachyrhizi]WFU53502.1 hypothetical protein QA639_28045 [Bradyrhizobium pachyrhizi]WOH79315.1 hypothetical protein RX327_25965 [Bradyrhizobium sp. BEA-2-5]